MAEDVSEPVEQIRLSEREMDATIKELCRSKADEFRMLGYEHVAGTDIWNCLSEKYEKNGEPLLHQMVNDILSLKVTTLMNWMTMSIYRNNARF
ncbi:post-transcriptional regulator [Paenibacillus hodogayensis]|uniref:Post-transcriptional regulator n=1 Tax=Paenibacillus hodogayensis TaxID=279208 RepID=A0ABV5VVY5_9BACL